MITHTSDSSDVKQSSGLQKDYKYKFKYFIASYTWQGVYRGSCNKVSHTHTHENFTSDPKSNQDKVKVTNLKKIPKLQILKFCKKLFHATQILKLLDKMYKYEMGPTRTVGATDYGAW